MSNGLYFLHEHPATASSWKNKHVMDILDRPEVQRIVSPMCAFGMMQEDEEGEALVKKDTAFMTNSRAIAERLERKCGKDHRHIVLIGGRAKRAEVYPEELCRQIIRGLVEQMAEDGRIGAHRGKAMLAMGIGARDPIEEGNDQAMQSYETWDDVSGKPLDTAKVKKARKEEMVEFAKHGVYHKVPIQECWDKTGKAPLGIRWIDINKGDDKDEEYRSRLVAKEIKKDNREDLFAATPPLEAKKMLFSMAMTGEQRQG